MQELRKEQYGDLIIKFKPVLPNNLTSEQLLILKELFPKINDKKQLSKDQEFELELATESDFEYSDSEDDSDDDSDDDDDDSDDDSDDSDDSDDNSNS